MSKKINESAWKTLGKAALDAVKPMLKKGGKKLFRKAARTGIKKFGKRATRQIVNGAKQLAKNPEVQQAALDAGKEGINAIKNKFKKKPVSQPTHEQLVENWSNIVDSAMNEAYGFAIKAGLTGAKAAIKGAKAASKVAKAGGKANKMANIGSAVVDDLKGTAQAANDGSHLGLVKNTFKDENGNWSFNPIRGIKKHVVGKAKSLDDAFTGGLGQMALDSVTGNNEEENQQQMQQPSSKKVKKPIQQKPTQQQIVKQA
jgi:hypothetical protein